MINDGGFIGDVKYSLLEPGIFLAEHPGWQLLQGQELEVSIPLASLGVKKLPDARGLFIRGMNMGRADQFADPDGETRNITDPQTDGIAAHSHTIERIFSIGEAATGWGGGPNNMVHSTYGATRQTQNSGIAETRPKNIAVYIYVKVS